MTARRISILGSTGSIGQNTLDLVRRSGSDKFQVVALTANTNASDLAKQAIEFNAEFVALADETNANTLRSLLSDTDVEVGIGPGALKEAASIAADFTMAAIIGAAGLEPTLAAIAQGNHIGLANKETLVCAGDLVMARVKEAGARLLPVDSEHNAIFQVLETEDPSAIRRLILTASGGPFLGRSANDMSGIKPEDALKHPVWEMGAKISIDSATMMNKGLELIEARYLFNRPGDQIDVMIHPQSIVHSMVEYIDGSVLSQMGSPDMRTPIAYAMAWPQRMEAPVERLDLTKLSGLTFFEPDLEQFPALLLCRQALKSGSQATNILNAANEVAVHSFLGGDIKYTDIVSIVDETLGQFDPGSYDRFNLDDILALDAQARRTATDCIKRLR